jgi:hypothetical protein
VTNKKYTYFPRDYLGAVKEKQRKEKPAFYGTEN